MLALIVSAFVIGGSLIMMFGLLPEEHADEFRSLSDGNMTFQSDIITIQKPSLEDDTLVYAINDVAATSVRIAQDSTQVKAILNQVQGDSITIAGVQPTLLVDSSGKRIHSSVGQVIITANKASLDGRTFSQVTDFESIQGKQAEARQQIWSVIVDLDKSIVSTVSKDADRILHSIIRPNLIIAEMNMFLPHAVKANSGSTVRWTNDSTIPHNVVGSYVSNTSSEPVRIDSGFIAGDRSFQHTFEDTGIFDYRCTIHSEEGMKGILYIEN